MFNIFNSLLAIHVVSGGFALLTGLIIIFLKKGNALHKKAGRFYFWSMTSVASTAFVMSLMHNNPFLFMLAFFSFYLVYTGFWAHRQDEKARTGDWIIMALVFAAGAYRFYLTCTHPWNGNAIVPLIFSIGCMVLTIEDFIKYIRHRMYNTFSLKRHVVRMLASYIAAVTAFVVVNFNNVQPAWIPWFAPTVIGSILITIWTKKIVKNPEAFKGQA